MAGLAQREFDTSNLGELKRQLEAWARDVDAEVRAISGFWPLISRRAEAQVLRAGQTYVFREPFSFPLKLPSRPVPGDAVEFIKTLAGGTISLVPDAYSGINGAAVGTTIGYTAQGYYRFRYDGFAQWWGGKMS